MGLIYRLFSNKSSFSNKFQGGLFCKHFAIMQAKPFHVALHFANSSGKTGSMAFCQSRLRNRCSFFQVSPIGVVNPFHMGMHFANSRAKQVAAFSAWHFAIDVGGNRDGCSFFSSVANRGAVFFFSGVISPVRMAKILVIKKKFTIPNGEMVGYIIKRICSQRIQKIASKLARTP